MNNGIVGQGVNSIATPYALLGGASAPTLPLGAPTPQFALDIAPGATAAYSLRRLSSSYTGPVVRVRRSGTNAERDFTAEEVAAGVLATWLGPGNVAFPSVAWGATDYTGNIFGIGNSASPTQTTGVADPFGGTAAVSATWSVTSHRLGTRTDGLQNGLFPPISAPITLSFWARVPTGTATIQTAIRSNPTPAESIASHNITTTWTRFTHTSQRFADNGLHGFYVTNATINTPIEFYGFQFETGTQATDLVITTTQSVGIGLVVVWYDQSGAGRHVPATTIAAAPFIAASGYMVVRNGRPYVAFDYGKNLIRAGESIAVSNDGFVTVGSRGSTTSGRGYFSLAELDRGGFENSLEILGWHGAGVSTYNPPTNTRELWSGDILRGRSSVYRRGVAVGFTDAPTLIGRATWIALSIGSNTGRPMGAGIEELVYYAHGTDKRSALEANMAGYYGFTLAPQVNDPDAQAWVNNVYSAGSTVNAAVARAVNDFVVGCKTDGIWSAIKAACILCGADTLAGALIPLVGAAPTNFSFVSTDYNRLTGLAGNGSTKYLNVNRGNAVDPQNSKHISYFTSSAGNATRRVFSSTWNLNGGSEITRGTTYSTRINAAYTANVGDVTVPATAHFIGASRGDAANVTLRVSGSSITLPQDSMTPDASNMLLFFDTISYSNARIAFYSIGESLDLALLDARVSALVAAIGAAPA